MVIGHEAAGVVTSIGPGVTNLDVGDHVVFVFVPSCGDCIPCGEGRPALCEPGAKANVAGTLLGGSQRISLNGKPVTHHVGVSCFAEYGATKTIGVDLLDSKLELASGLGCDLVFKADDPEIIEKVKGVTNGGGDYAFECVGSEHALQLAYSLTKRGGMTCSSGLSHPKSQFSISHLSLVAEEKTIKGSYLGSCVPKRDIPRYIELFEAGSLPIDSLMSEKLSLDQVNEGFDKLASGETVRQLITFD
jgi:alcohol dehydrogenase